MVTWYTKARRTALVGLAALAALCAHAGATPARAVAQKAAFLPPGGDRDLPVYFRTMALEAVATVVASEGIEVLDRGAVHRTLRAADLHRCERTDCADDVARATQADFAVGVAVWAAEGARREPGTVAVSLVDAREVSFSGTAVVAAGDVEAAARSAYVEARRKQLLGPGPWLAVEGTPLGAMVLLDGTAAGVLPYRAAIRPGRHVLLVRLRGYRSVARTLDIGLETNREHRVEVALEPDPDGAAARAEDGAAPPAAAHPPTARIEAPAADAAPPAGDGRTARGGRSTLDVVGPLVLGLGGLAAVGAAGYGLLAPDRCTERAGDTCLVREDAPNGPAIAAWGGVGAAALIGALVWLVLGGRDGTPDAPSGEATPRLRLHLGATDVGVRFEY